MKHFCSFSEAIREGAKLKPQAYGDLESKGKTCAIGAGLDAMGYADIGEAWSDAVSKYPYMEKGLVWRRCPVEQCYVDRFALYQMVTHLNDDHEWTREAIAGWLEAEEEKLGFVTLIENPAEVTTQEKALVTA